MLIPTLFEEVIYEVVKPLALRFQQNTQVTDLDFEDFFQEGYLAALQSKHHFKGDPNRERLAKFIWRVVRNRFITLQSQRLICTKREQYYSTSLPKQGGRTLDTVLMEMRIDLGNEVVDLVLNRNLEEKMSKQERQARKIFYAWLKGEN